MNDKNNNVEFQPNDFEFAQKDKRIYDKAFETEPIGYFKDAVIRFKRSKSSVVAFVILSILIILSIIGPYFNQYRFTDSDGYLAYLPPKIPLLEDIGIFDGYYTRLDQNLVRYQTLELNHPELDITYSNRYIVDICKDGVVVDGECVGENAYVYEDLRGDVTYDAYLYKNYIIGYEIEEPMIFTSQVWEDTNVLDYVIGDYEYFADSDQYAARINYYAYLGYEDGETPYYWFGTTEEGKDIFTMLWIGSQVSLIIAVIISFINISIGLVYGAVSGYYGGRVDLTMQRIIEILGGIPWIVIATLVMMRWGSTLPTVIVAFVLTGWIGNSRMVRAQFYRYKSREYVLASRTLGAHDIRLMGRHILPNAIGTIITASILTIPAVIFSEATLSYLGIISLQDTVTVGTLLESGQSVLTQYPFVLFFPAVYISLLMISFNLFGNGLRDAFNPSLRGSE